MHHHTCSATTLHEPLPTAPCCDYTPEVDAWQHSGNQGTFRTAVPRRDKIDTNMSEAFWSGFSDLCTANQNSRTRGLASASVCCASSRLDGDFHYQIVTQQPVKNDFECQVYRHQHLACVNQVFHCVLGRARWRHHKRTRTISFRAVVLPCTKTMEQCQIQMDKKIDVKNTTYVIHI